MRVEGDQDFRPVEPHPPVVPLVLHRGAELVVELRFVVDDLVDACFAARPLTSWVRV